MKKSAYDRGMVEVVLAVLAVVSVLAVAGLYVYLNGFDSLTNIVGGQLGGNSLVPVVSSLPTASSSAQPKL